MWTSAESRVIASFAFVVSLFLGSWTGMDQLVTGSSSLLPGSEVGRLAVALVPFAATGVAFQATGATEVAWARALGGAAVMLGLLACVGGVLYFIAYT